MLMDINKLLNSIFDEFLREVRTNHEFKNRIIKLVEENTKGTNKQPSRPHRRAPGLFDPMTVYREQPETLKPRLEGLEIEQLKDIIAEHGMDRAKLAMKWQKKDRLIELIITTIQTRTQKGDAFRAS